MSTKIEQAVRPVLPRQQLYSVVVVLYTAYCWRKLSNLLQPINYAVQGFPYILNLAPPSCKTPSSSYKVGGQSIEDDAAAITETRSLAASHSFPVCCPPHSSTDPVWRSDLSGHRKSEHKLGPVLQQRNICQRESQHRQQATHCCAGAMDSDPEELSLWHGQAGVPLTCTHRWRTLIAMAILMCVGVRIAIHQ